jgi:hypothetical protein
MYIVRNKKTKEILHVNPAPLTQKLKGKEIYFKFDPKKMETGEIDGDLPEHFKIDEKGKIVEFTLQEKVETGIVALKPGQKMEDNQIVEKTLSEKAADGLITLSPTQKITGKGKHEKIVEKTLSEQIADGTKKLTPNQKLIGKGKDERIVEKTLSEQVKEGLITLEPGQKITGKGENEQIVEKSRQEQLDEGLITLEKIKEEHIQRLRVEAEAFFSRHKTTNGYRLDQLTRQKAIFSYRFRDLPDTDDNKKALLEQRLIYPNHILDEIVAEIAKVQAAYDTAKSKIIEAYENKKPVNVFEAISL